MIAKLKKFDSRLVLTALIVIGGIAWIYFHTKTSAPRTVGTADNPDVSSQFQSYPYPNSDGSPLVSGDTNYGDAPVSLTYNFPSDRTMGIKPQAKCPCNC